MNKLEFQTHIAKYLEEAEESFMERLDLFVQLCEEDIARQVQLPHCRKNAVSNCIANNPYISTPPYFMSSYSLAIIAQGEYRFLTSKEVNFIREFAPNSNEVGVPRYWAQFDHNSFIVAPTPAQNYDIELHYFGRPDSLVDVNDNGTTWLLSNCENAMLFGTLMQGYIYLKGDQDVINAYKLQFDKAVAALQIIYEGRQRKDSYRNIDKRQPV